MHTLFVQLFLHRTMAFETLVEPRSRRRRGGPIPAGKCSAQQHCKDDENDFSIHVVQLYWGRILIVNYCRRRFR